MGSKFPRGFNPPTDCLEVGLKQSLERRKKKVCIGTGFICTSLEEEDPRERGWCKAAITVRSVWLFPFWNHSGPGVGSGFLSPLNPGGSGSYPEDLLRLERGFGHCRATVCAGAVSPVPRQLTLLRGSGRRTASLRSTPTPALATIQPPRAEEGGRTQSVFQVAVADSGIANLFLHSVKAKL